MNGLGDPALIKQVCRHFDGFRACLGLWTPKQIGFKVGSNLNKSKLDPAKL